MGLPTLAEAIASGDRFSVEAAAAEQARNAYNKGYLEGVQDQQLNLRYAIDTGPLTSPIAWFRFRDDAELAASVLSTAWEDLRVVDIRSKGDTHA